MLFKGKVNKYSNKIKYVKFEKKYEDLYPLLNKLSCATIHRYQRETESNFLM